MQTDVPIPLIRVAVLAPVLRHLTSYKVGIRDFLADVGTSERRLERREGLIPLRHAARLIEEGAAYVGAGSFGLAAGLNASFQSLGVFGGLVLESSTLEEAIRAVFRFVPSFNSGERWGLVREGERARLHHRFLGEFDASPRQADRYSLGLAVNLIRAVAGPAWKPEQIELSTPADTDRLDAFEPLRGAQISFDRPVMSVTFPAAFLRRMLPRATCVVPTANVDDWLMSAPAEDFVHSFQQVVLTTAREQGHPRIEDAARALRVSVRTLQRKLTDIGSSFDSLMQASRFETAEHLLRSTDARVLDIALDLGYSDHAHFSRAFRRWTGLSPRAYRYAHRGRSATIPSSMSPESSAPPVDARSASR